MSLDPTTWLILVPGATTAVPAASLGITELTRHRASLSPDTVIMTLGGANVGAVALFAFGQTVTIQRVNPDDSITPWFVGRVTQTPASGNGSAQNQSYTLSGPWWYLENLTYRQQWVFQGGAVEQFIGRLILGQALDGSFITTGAVITEMLQYAISAGAPFQIGPVPPPVPPQLVWLVSSTILTGYLIPLDEVKDVSCAEVFRKMARWHPDAVSWFDYTTSPPTLNFQSGSPVPAPSTLPAGVPPVVPLSAATLTVGQPPLVSVGELTPRYDLVAPAVVIHYEVTTTSNGAVSTSLVTDAWPATATGNEFASVVLTIPLRGSSSTTVQQPVQVRPIEDTLDDTALVPYLIARYGGELAIAAADPNITADGISITAVSRALADPNATQANPLAGQPGQPATIPVVYDDSLANDLLEGSITPWMVSQFAIQEQAQLITFTYTLDSGSGGSGDTSISGPQTRTLAIRATNAVTQVYTTLTNYNAGDAVPVGLAQYYWNTLQLLQWSGRIVLTEQAAGASVPTAALGSLLNVAGSANPAWAAMHALIVAEETQASTGRTTLTIGPAKHLSPQDLVARLYVTRPGGTGGREGSGAKGTQNSDARTTGNAGSDTVGFGDKHPIQNSAGSGTAAASTQPFQLVSADDQNGPKVRVLASTAANTVPSGFSPGDDPPYVLDVSDGDVFYACVTWDVSGATPGGVTSCTLGNGSSLPTDDSVNGTFYYQFGSVQVTDGASSPTNTAYGPIDATCERKWFSNPADFTVAWNGAS